MCSKRGSGEWTPERRAKAATATKRRWDALHPLERERRTEELRERLAKRRAAPGYQDAITAGMRRNLDKITGDRNPMRRPEVAAKVSANNAMHDPAIRDKHKLAINDPAVKAKQIAGVRAYHARRKAARGDG